MNDKDLTAYCGLYCGDCVRYRSRASELAEELLSEIERTRLSEYAEVKRLTLKEFENFDLTISSLREISNLNCDTACRLGGEGCGGSCEIKMCIANKSLEGCWECDLFEKCDKFVFLKPFHDDAPINNLRLIRRHGLADWTKHRDKCYPWL